MNLSALTLICASLLQISLTPPDEKRRRQREQQLAESNPPPPAILQPYAFGPTPFLSFENIPEGKTTSRILIIRNPSQKSLLVSFTLTRDFSNAMSSILRPELSEVDEGETDTF